jgi:hypothetical protein
MHAEHREPMSHGRARSTDRASLPRPPRKTETPPIKSHRTVPQSRGLTVLHRRVMVTPGWSGGSYLDELSVDLTASAYFLWSACGLTPAQEAILAQLCPAARACWTW